MLTLTVWKISEKNVKKGIKLEIFASVSYLVWLRVVALHCSYFTQRCYWIGFSRVFTFLKAQKHAKDLWGWFLNAFDFEFEEFFGILMRMLRHAVIRCGLAFSLLSRWLWPWVREDFLVAQTCAQNRLLLKSILDKHKLILLISTDLAEARWDAFTWSALFRKFCPCKWRWQILTINVLLHLLMWTWAWRRHFWDTDEPQVSDHPNSQAQVVADGSWSLTRTYLIHVKVNFK